MGYIGISLNRMVFLQLYLDQSKVKITDLIPVLRKDLIISEPSRWFGYSVDLGPSDRTLQHSHHCNFRQKCLEQDYQYLKPILFTASEMERRRRFSVVSAPADRRGSGGHGRMGREAGISRRRLTYFATYATFQILVSGIFTFQFTINFFPFNKEVHCKATQLINSHVHWVSSTTSCLKWKI